MHATLDTTRGFGSGSYALQSEKNPLLGCLRGRALCFDGNFLEKTMATRVRGGVRSSNGCFSVCARNAPAVACAPRRPHPGQSRIHSITLPKKTAAYSGRLGPPAPPNLYSGSNRRKRLLSSKNGLLPALSRGGVAIYVSSHLRSRSDLA